MSWGSASCPIIVIICIRRIIALLHSNYIQLPDAWILVSVPLEKYCKTRITAKKPFCFSLPCPKFTNIMPSSGARPLERLVLRQTGIVKSAYSRFVKHCCPLEPVLIQKAFLDKYEKTKKRMLTRNWITSYTDSILQSIQFVYKKYFK